MPLTSGNFARLLEPGLKEIFTTAVNRPEPIIDLLFGMETSNKGKEEYQAIGTSGLVPPFAGTVPYEDVHGGYMTTIRNYEFAQGITAERNLLDDEQYNVIRRRAMSLGDSFATTVEHDAAQVFINAFTDSGSNRMGASVAGADAVGLCSTAHPNRPDNTGSTQSNEGTLALNIANLDTTKQNMMNWTDDKGNLLGVIPDLLLVPAELERTATQIVSERAIYEPGSAQFDVNMFAGRIKPVIWNRLSDANAWFLISSVMMKKFLIFQWRIRPEFATQDDFDGLTAKFRGYMRYGMGWLDWRFIYGQNPS